MSFQALLPVLYLLIAVGGGYAAGRNLGLAPRKTAYTMLATASAILLTQLTAQLLRQHSATVADWFGGAARVGLYAWCALAICHLAGSKSSAGSCRMPGNVMTRHLAEGAAALLVAGKFALFEVGKLSHNAEMEEFFRQSGYDPRLHYVVAAGEMLGSVMILLPFWQVRIAAGLGLLSIMAGAVVTHVRNGDPLSSSVDAILQAVLLILLLALVISRSRRNAGATELPTRRRGRAVDARTGS